MTVEGAGYTPYDERAVCFVLFLFDMAAPVEEFDKFAFGERDNNSDHIHALGQHLCELLTQGIQTCCMQG